MAKVAAQEKNRKKDDLQLNIDLDQYGRKHEDREILGKFKWESKLLEIHGQTLKLRHKHIEENESTINFEFNQKSIPLGNNITLEPDQSIGQVSAYGGSSAEQGTCGIAFFRFRRQAEIYASELTKCRRADGRTGHGSCYSAACNRETPGCFSGNQCLSA